MRHKGHSSVRSTSATNLVIWKQIGLNVSKTKSKLVKSRHQDRNDSLYIVLKGMEIDEVQDVKLLGVIIDDKWSCGKQINSIVKKMGRNISCFRSYNSFLLSSTRVLVVK